MTASEKARPAHRGDGDGPLKYEQVCSQLGPEDNNAVGRVSQAAFDGQLRAGHYGAILADPPWKFRTWSADHHKHSSTAKHYPTMWTEEICALPVGTLAAPDSVLLIWIIWPMLEDALRVIDAWGFQYKTCGFSWMKADPYRLFADEATPFAGMGYWTRSNSEVCLLATRGKPKRQAADVRQGIIAPRREHSRKPEGIHQRIERLVAGPYAELFARQRRPGWDCWGNEIDKFGVAT